MSYRELRNFCEIMRSLGYSRPISVENFRLPNFELVADLSLWFAERYDPTCDISDNINEERDRVVFVQSICRLFMSKARIKLNPIKLYGADGYAVKELLKIASMLNKAMNASAGDPEEDIVSSSADFNLSSRLSNLKGARALANEITEVGAKLHDSLTREPDLREKREKAVEFLDSMSRNLGSNTEQEYLEKCIRDLIENQESQKNQMKEMIANLVADEQKLENKIQRKTAELERSEKRLKTIQDLRPGYMDEYEKCEQELEKYFNMYIEKFKNLDYLESQLDEYNRKELEKKKENEEILKKIQAKYKMDEYKIISEGNEDGNLMKEMGSTRTGFNNVKGGLADDDDDDEDDEDEGEASDDEDGEPIDLGSDDDLDEDDDPSDA